MACILHLTDEALRFDSEAIKANGLQHYSESISKWSRQDEYYHADKLGMLVMAGYGTASVKLV